MAHNPPMSEILPELDVPRDTHTADQHAELRQIPVELIQRGRYQPRTRFRPEELKELAATLRSEGVVQPIVVRPIEHSKPQKYELIAGERRWRAAQLAGLDDIPAIVRAVDDATALTQALIENYQREDLNPVELARGISRLIDEFDLSQEQAAQRLGLSRTSVAHYLRLLRLAPHVKALIEENKVSFGHAKVLASIPEDAQCRIADQVVKGGLSVRKLERLVKKYQTSIGHETPKTHRDPDIHRLEQRLGEISGVTTRIDHSARTGGGSLTFRYHSLEELQGLLERFKGFDQED